LNVLAILTLVGEIGTNMAKWRNEKAFEENVALRSVRAVTVTKCPEAEA
jgi:hypothetical protein